MKHATINGKQVDSRKVRRQARKSIKSLTSTGEMRAQEAKKINRLFRKHFGGCSLV